jgi:hypothetical protein
MARTINETTITQHLEPEPTPAFEEAVRAVNTLAAIDQQAADNAVAVARQLGYDGTLTVGALEDEIRFYQRRTVEACLELGKRLLILKELTPHGEFESRAELLGISKRMAQKFMSATLKISKTNSNSLLKAAGTQTKLLELLVLDDGEIEVLENGGSVRGVTLDAIEMMSVSELKKALREARDTATAKDRVISEKTAELNRKAEKLALLETAKRQEVTELTMPGSLQLSWLQTYTREITAKIEATLRSEIVKLYGVFDDQPPRHIQLAAAQSLGLIITAAYGVAHDLAISPVTEPEMAADDPAKANAEAFMKWQDDGADLESLMDEETLANYRRVQAMTQRTEG